MKQLRLGDSLEVLIDHRGKTPTKLGGNFVTCGVPVASAILVKDGTLDLSDTRFVSEAMYRKWMPSPVRQGDVILTSEAPCGRVALVPSDEPLVLGQRLFGLRGKVGVLDSRYLYYALQTVRVQSDLAGRTTGTTVVGIRQSALRDVEIIAPEFIAQRAIAEVLGALDDKIAANRRSSGLTAELARVQFDAARATDGYAVAIREIAVLVTRGIAPEYTDGEGLIVLNQKCIRGQSVSLESSRITAHGRVRSEKCLRRNDVLVNSTGYGTLGRSARWIRTEEATVDSHVSIVRFDRVLVDPVVAGHAVLAQEAHIEGLAEGSTGQTELSRSQLGAVPLNLPSRAVQPNLSALLDGLDRTRVALDAENLALAGLRDTLLPRLMSGKLSVKDAEQQVGGVV